MNFVEPSDGIDELRRHNLIAAEKRKKFRENQRKCVVVSMVVVVLLTLFGVLVSNRGAF